MILGISRFKVLNGREPDVKEAFFNRPQLVDSVPGFLGMETFTETKDQTAFYLVTRWTDEHSFRAWHASPAHHQSHRGMPKGLRLDASFAEIIVLERLADAGRPRTLAEAVQDCGALITETIAGSSVLHLFVCDSNGEIKLCNAIAVQGLGLTVDEILGKQLATFLVPSDAEKVMELVRSTKRDCKISHVLNFVSTTNEPRTLVCRIDCHPSHFALIGEQSVDQELSHYYELHDLNNQLATLARENARKTKELAQANAKLQSTLDELNRSYWHLSKVAEVMPMCVVCGKIKSDEAQWQDVAEYFRTNSLLVSHGCCPPCQQTLEKKMGLE